MNADDCTPLVRTRDRHSEGSGKGNTIKLAPWILCTTGQQHIDVAEVAFLLGG